MVRFANAVLVNDAVPIVDKLDTDVAAWFDNKFVFCFCQVLHHVHQRGFAAANRTSQQHTFIEINTELKSCLLVSQEICNEPINYSMVAFNYPESCAV